MAHLRTRMSTKGTSVAGRGTETSKAWVVDVERQTMTSTTIRYFVSHDSSGPLIRVDLNPDRRLSQRLQSDGWVDVPSLTRIALFYGEELSWDEISAEVAADLARRITGDAAVLAE